MAYDKVVDSTALENNLKLIGDAVREKGGTSDLLQFPQGFIDAIKSIQAGGGASVATGTFTPTEDIEPSTKLNNPLVIEHNLGYVPTFVFIGLKSNNYIEPRDMRIQTITAVRGSQGNLGYDYGTYDQHFFVGSAYNKCWEAENFCNDSIISVYKANKKSVNVIVVPNYIYYGKCPKFRAGQEYMWVVM